MFDEKAKKREGERKEYKDIFKRTTLSYSKPTQRHTC
jgi:hypothetical protein